MFLKVVESQQILFCLPNQKISLSARDQVKMNISKEIAKATIMIT